MRSWLAAAVLIGSPIAFPAVAQMPEQDMGAMAGEMSSMAGMHHGGGRALVGSTPREGAVLTSSPSALALTFKAAMPLASLQLFAWSGARIPLAGALPPGPTSRIVIDLPRLPPDTYEIRWRTGGEQADSGSIGFQLR